MNWLQTILNRWKAFRAWQIGDCTQAAGQGNMTLGREFFRGTIDNAMPFLTGETFRTLQHLLFRPGYMIREFLRGKDNHILPPLTAMIIFFALQLLLTNMVTTGGVAAPDDVYNSVKQKLEESENVEGDDARLALQIVENVAYIYYITHLDLCPEKVHTPAQHVLAGLEGWLRGQGVFSFIFLLLLLSSSLWIVGRRSYRLTFSAAAIIAAYMLCQLCFFNTLVTLFTLGERQLVPFWFLFLILFENIYQLLGVGFRRTLGYVFFLSLTLFLLMAIGILIFAAAVSFYAYGQM